MRFASEVLFWFPGSSWDSAKNLKRWNKVNRLSFHPVITATKDDKLLQVSTDISIGVVYFYLNSGFSNRK